MTEQQRHLPPASKEIKTSAAIAVDLQQPLSEALCAAGNLVGQVFR